MPPPQDVSDKTGYPGIGENSKVTLSAKHSETEVMKATTWAGKKSITVQTDRPKPIITDDQDAIIKVTSTAICGSDLHMYVGAMPGMTKGDVMGHEFMGIIEHVGPGVKFLRPGDRVVAAFELGCGTCMYCNKELFSSCDVTNPSEEQKALYGHNTAGIHGYSQLTGGYEGGQAEYARVVFADTNLIKVPREGPDDKYLFLSDILPTAWYANELGNVGKGDTVAIWGAGPVGMLAAQCAWLRKASRVIIIDCLPYRLKKAQEVAPGTEIINFRETPTLERMREICPNGPDVALECVGFHYTENSWLDKIEMALMFETDPSAMLNELITTVRKGGRLGIVGIYAGFTNHFNIGAFMEKGLRMGAGQTPCQAYWKELMQYIEDGKLRPYDVISHHLPLEDAAQGYKIFNEKIEGCVKVVLQTKHFTDLQN